MNEGAYIVCDFAPVRDARRLVKVHEPGPPDLPVPLIHNPDVSTRHGLMAPARD